MDIKNILSYIQVGISTASNKAFYIILLLYYAYRNENTPAWAKKIILGSIAYVLNPIDAVPDLTPFIGFTDDIGVISFGLVSIACYIDDAVRKKAKSDMSSLMGNKLQLDKLKEVDSWL